MPSASSTDSENSSVTLVVTKDARDGRETKPATEVARGAKSFAKPRNTNDDQHDNSSNSSADTMYKESKEKMENFPVEEIITSSASNNDTATLQANEESLIGSQGQEENETRKRPRSYDEDLHSLQTNSDHSSVLSAGAPEVAVAARTSVRKRQKPSTPPHNENVANVDVDNDKRHDKKKEASTIEISTWRDWVKIFLQSGLSLYGDQFDEDGVEELWAQQLDQEQSEQRSSSFGAVGRVGDGHSSATGLHMKSSRRGGGKDGVVLSSMGDVAIPHTWQGSIAQSLVDQIMQAAERASVRDTNDLSQESFSMPRQQRFSQWRCQDQQRMVVPPPPPQRRGRRIDRQTSEWIRQTAAAAAVASSGERNKQRQLRLPKKHTSGRAREGTMYDDLSILAWAVSHQTTNTQNKQSQSTDEDLVDIKWESDNVQPPLHEPGKKETDDENTEILVRNTKRQRRSFSIDETADASRDSSKMKRPTNISDSFDPLEVLPCNLRQQDWIYRNNRHHELSSDAASSADDDFPDNDACYITVDEREDTTLSYAPPRDLPPFPESYKGTFLVRRLPDWDVVLNNSLGDREVAFSSSTLLSKDGNSTVPFLIPPPRNVGTETNERTGGVRGPARTNSQVAEMCHAVLAHLSGQSRFWAKCEFFYSDIDKPWFQRNEFVRKAAALGVPPGILLTRWEWNVIRRSIRRKPRRFSTAFVNQQRRQLERYRSNVRRSIVNAAFSIPQETIDYAIPALIPIGTTVTAYHPKYKLLQRGTVVSWEEARHVYLVRFPPPYGIAFCPDVNVARHGVRMDYFLPAKCFIVGGWERYGHSLDPPLEQTGNKASDTMVTSRILERSSERWDTSGILAMMLQKGLQCVNSDLNVERGYATQVEQAAERESLTIALSVTEAALERKQRLIKCLDKLHEAFEDEGLGDDEEQLKSMRMHYAWVLANLQTVNETILVSRKYLRGLYGNCYLPRPYRDELSRDIILQAALANALNSAPRDSQMHAEYMGKQDSEDNQSDPTHRGLWGDWERFMVKHLVNCEDVAGEKLQELMMKKKSNRRRGDSETTTNSNQPNALLFGKMLLSCSYLENHVDDVARLHGIQVGQDILSASLREIGEGLVASGECQIHRPELREGSRLYLETLQARDNAWDELRNAVASFGTEAMLTSLQSQAK